MRFYLRSKRINVDAVADYNIETECITVLKGSKVTEKISHSEKFRSAKSIEKSRKDFVYNSIVTQDITFKSASSAANFITGVSTNGLIAWKNEEGITLKRVIAEMEGKY